MRILEIVLFIIFVSQLSATIINVPADQSTIQEGINFAVNGDTVLVQPSIYFENIDFIGKDITVASLFLIAQDSIYINQTVINGNHNGSVVTFENGENYSAVLIGFTITNGFGNGAGIHCYYSNPSLNHLIISGNSAYLAFGGGIYCNNSSPVIQNVLIAGNTALGEYASGGGIYLSSSSPVLINVTIANNSAFYGGGIRCSSSSPIFENVEITNNSAVYDPAWEMGGSGGGIYSYNSLNILKNVTISNNYATYYGGGIYGSNLTLVNCILWNNSPEEIYGSATATYSNIQGGLAGTGNIDQDPLFVVNGGYPFSLLEDSPCIDSGNPDPIYYDPEDPGNPGYALYPAMGTITNDMGAYGGPNTIGWPAVSVDDNVIVQASDALLMQNYPNPFNPSTTIDFSIHNDSNVDLSIFNIKGQKIKTIAHNEFTKGNHSINWNGDDESGNSVSSGVYLYKLKVNDKTELVRKCLLLK